MFFSLVNLTNEYESADLYRTVETLDEQTFCILTVGNFVLADFQTLLRISSAFGSNRIMGYWFYINMKMKPINKEEKEERRKRNKKI